MASVVMNSVLELSPLAFRHKKHDLESWYNEY